MRNAFKEDEFQVKENTSEMSKSNIKPDGEENSDSDDQYMNDMISRHMRQSSYLDCTEHSYTEDRSFNNQTIGNYNDSFLEAYDDNSQFPQSNSAHSIAYPAQEQAQTQN